MEKTLRISVSPQHEKTATPSISALSPRVHSSCPQSKYVKAENCVSCFISPCALRLRPHEGWGGPGEVGPVLRPPELHVDPAHLSLRHLVLASGRDKGRGVLDMEGPREKAKGRDKAKWGCFGEEEAGADIIKKTPASSLGGDWTHLITSPRPEEETSGRIMSSGTAFVLPMGGQNHGA